jgi:hypothetical protein
MTESLWGLKAHKEKAMLLAEAAQQTAELADLPNRDAQDWPPPVAELVSQQVQQAASSAIQELQQTASRNLAQAEVEREEALAAQAQLNTQVEMLSNALNSAESQIRQIQVEMREQERVLQERVQRLDTELAGAREVAGEAEELRLQVQDLREDLQEADVRGAEMQAQLSVLQKQLEEAQAWEVHSPCDEPLSTLNDGKTSGEPPTVTSPQGTSEREQPVSTSSKGAAVANEGAAIMVQYWKGCFENAQQRVAALEAEVSSAQAELHEERHTHELRTLSDMAKHDEIADLRAQQGRGSVDIEYLKNALLGFFESGELPANTQVFVVLERLLCLTEKDKARLYRVQTKAGVMRTPSKGRSGFSLFR